MNKEDQSLDLLNIKPVSKILLLALSKLGRSSVADLAVYINKPKSSVYDGLSELAQKGLVIEEGEDRVKLFVLSDIAHIQEIQKKEVANIENTYKAIINLASDNSREIVSRPRIRFYTGVEGIRQAFRDVEWSSRYKDAYLMWPMKDMIDTLGEDFLKFHGEGRYKHGVVLHSIRKESDRKLNTPNHEWLKNDLEEKLREVRYASKDMEWGMSFWAYGDQVLFAGGGSENFALLVKSKDFTKLMILLWKQTWIQSKN